MDKGYFTMGNEIYKAVQSGDITGKDFLALVLASLDIEGMKRLYDYLLEQEKI